MYSLLNCDILQFDRSSSINISEGCAASILHVKKYDKYVQQ
jgi:hypothetical protein